MIADIRERLSGEIIPVYMFQDKRSEEKSIYFAVKSTK